jgi:hypothetical protein
MRSSARVKVWLVAIAAVSAAIASPIGAQLPRAPLVLEPMGARGEAILAAFEGWGPDQNGDTVLLLGYYNRNKSQELEIPVGPDNRIEPDGPDYGQPTHFYPSRQHGVFAIKVPKDFGTKKLTWTLTANGQTSTVSFWLNPPYWVNFFKHPANGNEPPVVRFDRNGPTLTGPPVGIAQTLSGTVGKPVALTVWASDVPTNLNAAEDELAARNRTATANRNPESIAVIGGQIIGGAGRGAAPGAGGGGVRTPDVTVNWRKHRGPGDVTFAQDRIQLFTNRDPAAVLEAATTATFAAPGEYIVRAQVNDTSGDGGGGDQCCWTTAFVRVSVSGP